jgi:hypothetical protein
MKSSAPNNDLHINFPKRAKSRRKFLSQRIYISSPVQSPTSECNSGGCWEFVVRNMHNTATDCIDKSSVFFVRNMRNTGTECMDKILGVFCEKHAE